MFGDRQPSADEQENCGTEAESDTPDLAENSHGVAENATDCLALLSISAVRQIDNICVLFEQAWRGADRPRIEDYLDRGSHQIRRLLFRELLVHELELLQESGEVPAPPLYYQRFPDFQFEIDAAFAGTCHEHSLETETAVSARLSQRFEIQRELGAGAFGKVYLARDVELDRLVALKSPRTDRFLSHAELRRFAAEARAAAQLEHPGIVAVYDVITDSRGVIIVQQYIHGRDLDAVLKEQAMPARRAAEIWARIAEAMAYAHRHGYIHRDLKPKNILLDHDGLPHVADFGLAMNLRVRTRLRGERAGTPAYMSPEQVRGESHRLDGRSDIWSMGVIAYEMLTGERPFAGKNTDELFESVTRQTPRPLRSISPQVPEELERICLKCLCKRAAGRYANADELLEDLGYWLNEPSAQERPSADAATVVPKGLRSFDSDDRDFFLQLLPGVRDRQGLPDMVRFWKTRIESCAGELSFPVGLIYGPSGCGKSSILRAAIIPHLASHVIPLYVEASSEGTEAAVASSVRHHFRDLPQDASLAEMLQGLRAGYWSPPGKKVLIIIDQLEQWLQGVRQFGDLELTVGLRQCDGHRLQAILLVRDDYWAATTRFMQAIEVELVEGHNCWLIDLFESSHAKHVLTQFGQAYGRLPFEHGSLTQTHDRFLTQAVDELSQDGRVICVRLALFADMMKSKPWDPTSLKHLGGAQGLGLAFLEEFLSAPSAPARHRHHEAAVREVLALLLPDEGQLLKGHVRSHPELLRVSGYEEQPERFRDLLQILDHELRLITPVEPQGNREEDVPAGETCRQYQLTHDYLVTSIRDWLNRRKTETARGRAELALAERTTLWSQRREDRRLPSFLEFCRIALFTRRSYWKPDERALMRTAGGYYLVRGAAVFVVASVVSWVAVRGAIERAEVNQRQAAIEARQEEMRKQEAIAAYYDATRDVEVWLVEPDPRTKSQVLSRLATAAGSDVDIKDDALLRSLTMRTLTTFGLSNPTEIAAARKFHGRSGAISPDGRLWAIGQYRGSKCAVRLIEVETQRARDLWMRGVSFDAGDNGIVAVTFSSDGRWLAACSELGYVKVWDVEKIRGGFKEIVGEPDFGQGFGSVSSEDFQPRVSIDGVSASWQAHKAEVTSVSFSPDASLLATTSKDRTVSCWKVGSWEQTFGHTFSHHVSDAAWHFRGHSLLCATTSTVEIVFLDGTEPTLLADPIACDRVAFLGPRSSLAVLTEADRPLRLADCDKRTILPRSQWFSFSATGGVQVDGLALGSDGNLLVGKTADDKIWVWSVVDGRVVSQVASPAVRDIHIENDNVLVVQDRRADVFTLDSPVESFVAHQVHPIRKFCFSPEGDSLATTSPTSQNELELNVAIWSMNNERLWQRTATFADVQAGHSGDGPAIAFLSNKQLVVGTHGEARVFRLGNGNDDQEAATLEFQAVKDLVFASEFNEHLLIADAETLEAISSNFQQVQQIPNFDSTGGKALICLAQGGDRLATSDIGRRITIWRWQGGELSRERVIVDDAVDQYDVRALAFDRDGELLAVGNDAGHVRLIGMTDGVDYIEDKVSDDRITAITVGHSRLGQLAAAASRDGWLRLWLRQADVFNEFLTWRSPSAILQIELTPDGNKLAFVSSGERAVHVWDLALIERRLHDLGMSW